jgi:hypothetical protein
MITFIIVLLNAIAAVFLSVKGKFKDAKLALRIVIIIAVLTIIITSLYIGVTNNAAQQKLAQSQDTNNVLLNKIAQSQQKLAQTQDEFSAQLKENIGLQNKILMIQKNQQVRSDIPNPRGNIEITSPVNRSFVSSRETIEGLIGDANAKIWVIVHPDSCNYWVQQQVSVSSNGKWSVPGYFGRFESIDSGKSFEIIAIAYPNDSLSAGKIIDRWPEAQWYSNVIRVTRQ